MAGSDIVVFEIDWAEKIGKPVEVAGVARTGSSFVLTEQQFKEVAVKFNLADSHVIPVLANRYFLAEPKIYESMKPADQPKARPHRRRRIR